jgi:hypothetical protein
MIRRTIDFTNYSAQDYASQPLFGDDSSSSPPPREVAPVCQLGEAMDSNVVAVKVVVDEEGFAPVGNKKKGKKL